MPALQFPEDPEEVLEFVATNVAEYYAPGIGGAAVGALFSQGQDDEVDLSAILSDVTRRFTVLVKAAIAEDALRAANAALHSLQDVIRLLHRDIKANPTSWWRIALGEIRIGQADGESRRLINELESLGEAGQKALMTATSLRLLVLATIGSIPGRNATERANMIDVIKRYERLTKKYEAKIESNILVTVTAVSKVGGRSQWMDSFKMNGREIHLGLKALGITHGHPEYPFPMKYSEGKSFSDGSVFMWKNYDLYYYSKMLTNIPPRGPFDPNRREYILRREDAINKYENVIHPATVAYLKKIKAKIMAPYVTRFFVERMKIIAKWKNQSGGFNLND